MKKEELLKIAKPILFNTEMVIALLEGRKTVTRRLVKFLANRNPQWTGYVKDGLMLYNGSNEPCCKKTPYQQGDILYVRETWNYYKHDIVAGSKKGYHEEGYLYKASPEQKDRLPKFVRDHWGEKWKPSLHMPKEAARIFLKVKDVRVEKLWDITEKQALSEGVPGDTDYPISKVYCPRCYGDGLIGTLSENLGFMEVECHECDTAVKRFKHLWNSTINNSDSALYGWDADPWVWVIEFERIKVDD